MTMVSLAAICSLQRIPGPQVHLILQQARLHRHSNQACVHHAKRTQVCGRAVLLISRDFAHPHGQALL